MRKLFSLVPIIMILASGCARQTATPVNTPPPTVVSTATPTAATTPTPTLSAARTPTPTLARSATPTPTCTPMPSACVPLPEALEGDWVSVHDDWFGYSFMVPESWYIDYRASGGLLSFYNDSNLVGVLYPAAYPCGFMKLDFSTHGLGDLEGWEPDETMKSIIVGELSAWRRDEEGGEAGGPLSRSTTIYIPTDRYFYLFLFNYLPPTDASTQVREDYGEAYDAIIMRILGSFEISWQ